MDFISGVSPYRNIKHRKHIIQTDRHTHTHTHALTDTQTIKEVNTNTVADPVGDTGGTCPPPSQTSSGGVLA